jgi:hypothetical protein
MSFWEAASGRETSLPFTRNEWLNDTLCGCIGAVGHAMRTDIFKRIGCKEWERGNKRKREWVSVCERERERENWPDSRVDVLLLLFPEPTKFYREREIHSKSLVFISFINLVLSELKMEILT